jgi:CBS domain-containing protein
MADEQIRRIPVLSRAKRLVGIVAISDLIAAARSDQAGETLSAISRQSDQHNQSIH